MVPDLLYRVLNLIQGYIRGPLLMAHIEGDDVEGGLITLEEEKTRIKSRAGGSFSDNAVEEPNGPLNCATMLVHYLVLCQPRVRTVVELLHELPQSRGHV